MNILVSTDPRIKCVKDFDCHRSSKGKSSMIKDAIRFAEDDFKLKLEVSDEGFVLEANRDGERIVTSKIQAVKNLLKKVEIENFVEEVKSSTWQGVILAKRYTDETLIDKSFSWLTKWKSCPVDTVNELQNIHLQTVPTLSFRKYRDAQSIQSTTCRLCFHGNESVKHILSNCGFFLPTAFKRRHDKVLQWILFHFLVKQKMAEKCPAWYSKVTIKPYYENEDAKVFWDIPEYTGHEEEDATHAMRPDGKIVLGKKKEIYVLEMSVPWLDNRNAKFDEKESKYVDIVQGLKVNHPGCKVKQLTFIMDSLGGYSKELVESLKCLDFKVKGDRCNPIRNAENCTDGSGQHD